MNPEIVPDPPRILFVEDDDDVCIMLKIFFTGHGYQVNIAQLAYTAIEQIKVNHYDVIYLDQKLPDRNGIEVLVEAVKNNLINGRSVFLLKTTFWDFNTEQYNIMKNLPNNLKVEFDDSALDIEVLWARVNSLVKTLQRSPHEPRPSTT